MKSEPDFQETGTLYGMEQENVSPDIATFAKGMSNGGCAIGTVAVNSDLFDTIDSDIFLISTFGWTPVAAAASLATLKIHLREKMWEKAKANGEWFKKKLIEKLGTHPKVGDIRGVGLEIGLVFVTDREKNNPDISFAEKIARRALRQNLYLLTGDAGSIQLMPPLTTDRETLEEGIAIISDCVTAEYENKK